MWQYLQETHAKPETYSICVGYGYDIAEAEEFRKGAVNYLNTRGYAISETELPKYQIGATISVHTGPYPLGFGVIRKGI